MGSSLYSHETVKAVVDQYPFAAVFARHDGFRIDGLVEKLHQMKGGRQRIKTAADYADWSVKYSFVIGDTPEMISVAEAIENAAHSDSNVLISGETGTGKEVAANALHKLSERKNGPFITKNMADLPKDLVEAELFGATKGAYTSLDSTRKGLVESAEGGTLFSR